MEIAESKNQKAPMKGIETRCSFYVSQIVRK